MDLKSRLTAVKKKLFEKAYSHLNDKQREAVFSVNGPLLVLAGAGSGKTTVLVERTAFLVKYGNAYNNDNMPEELVFEPFIQKLEKIADDDNAPKELVETALASFVHMNAKPYEILAITFTNKAASEIKDRLENILGTYARDIWAGTFHSICGKILRMYIDRLGYENSYTIYDTDDQKRLMTSIIKEFEVSDKTFAPKSVLSEISRAKEKLLTPEEYEEIISKNDIRRRTILRLYKEYEKRKKMANAIDFDDMILLTVKLFEKEPEILERYRQKFRYILVDEYQDTNKAQFHLTKMLCNSENNIMAVGDDDQSIYRFRGATIDNILNFDKIFKDTKIVKLEQNYRSSDVIVDAANNVIMNNKGRKGKTLWTGNKGGEKISVYECDNQASEAQCIVNNISDMVAEGKYSFSDFAVLYRMNAQSNALENVFTKSGIPYRIIGGTRFYDRKEIKDIIAYLCVIANPGDSLRLKRIINVPKRGIGEATVAELEQISLDENRDMLSVALEAASYPSLSRSSARLVSFAQMMMELREGYERLPLGVLVEKVLEKSTYLAELAKTDEAESKDRTANVKELVSNAVTYANNTPDATLESFLEEVALVSDIDNYDKDAPAVVLMTIHSAKGLEFPVVFLPGLEEGIFPGSQTIGAGDDEMEEERRLAYVAITRAKKRLFMLHCHNRMVFGKTEFHQKSRFVLEIPDEYCDNINVSVDYAYARDKFSQSFDEEYENTYTDRNKENRPIRGEFTPSISKTSNNYYTKHLEAQKRATDSAEATVTFEVGERVIHPVFGDGTVIGKRVLPGDVMYEVAFDESGTKKIMGKFAKMHR